MDVDGIAVIRQLEEVLIAVEVEPGLAVGVPDPALAHPALIGAVEVTLCVGVDLEDSAVAVYPGAVDLCQGGGSEVVLAQLFGGVAGGFLVRLGDGVVCRVVRPAAGGQADAKSGGQQEGKKSFLFHDSDLLSHSLPGNGGKPN